MPTFDTSFKSVPHAGGRIRKTMSGKFAAERSDGGRIRRQTFETAGEAKQWLSELGARRNKQGRIATALTSDQLRDAVDAFHSLTSAGCEITLCELVRNHLDGVKRKAMGEAVAVLIEKYLEDGERRGQRARTLYDKQNRLKTFSALHGEQALGEITRGDVSAWLDGTGATGRNLRNFQTAIQGFFNWCEASVEGYSNDVARFPQNTVKDIQPAETVSAKNARRVLHLMEERNPNAALVLAIGLFGGLRTDEITGKAGLRWEDVDFELGLIFVQPGQAKTRRLRKVPMTQNLREWLLKYRRDAGRIATCEETFYDHRNAACRRLKIKWPNNAARHSFGTFYARLHGAHRAAEIMGHVGGIAMFTSHYEGKPVALAEAQAFFKIEPLSGDGAKIINMEGVA